MIPLTNSLTYSIKDSLIYRIRFKDSLIHRHTDSLPYPGFVGIWSIGEVLIDMSQVCCFEAKCKIENSEYIFFIFQHFLRSQSQISLSKFKNCCPLHQIPCGQMILLLIPFTSRVKMIYRMLYFGHIIAKKSLKRKQKLVHHKETNTFLVISRHS